MGCNHVRLGSHSNLHVMDLNNDSNTSKEESQTDFSEDEAHIEAITKILYENFYGCDMLLCLFITALQSYRVDRCLRPFPSTYIKDSNKDIDHLRSICENIPSLDKIFKAPQTCSKEIINFLVWLYCQKDQPSLHRTNYSQVEVPSPLKKSLQPHYVYEVIYPQKAEEIWQKRKNSRSSFLAYHGSQLDNFYSILKVGLQHHLSIGKELLYGKGIYLTTEILISMPYAPFGVTWSKSCLADKISVIAVCEVIDDLDKVKCKDSNCKERAVNQDSLSGNIPEKYFVITDSDMIRLKYLFVYKENTINFLESWIFKNIAVVLICTYLFLLFCIGFFQGPTWPIVKRHLYKMLYSH
ncbi:hypothetical protein FQR65_LT01615 [Abscondita terminalis]|nr:hypothetical protein FQR65_LT01615 [Abscondita terminalis]